MGLVAKIQQFVAKSRLATKAAIKVRNQCDAILAHRIGKENDGSKNGEHWFLKQYFSSKDRYVIDVGANRGDWIAAARRIGPSGIEARCYEPDPRAVSEFKSSVGETENLYLHEKAVGDTQGEIDLFLSQESTELTSAVDDSGKNSRRTVEVTTLDKEAEKHRIGHVDFLKIDVEGYEETVLRGASILLDEERIGCIQFEYGGNWAKAGATLQGVVSFLEGHGFEVFLLCPSCLRKVDFELISEYFSYSNYIAVHKDKMDRVTPIISPSPIL